MGELFAPSCVLLATGGRQLTNCLLSLPPSSTLTPSNTGLPPLSQSNRAAPPMPTQGLGQTGLLALLLVLSVAFTNAGRQAEDDPLAHARAAAKVSATEPAYSKRHKGSKDSHYKADDGHYVHHKERPYYEAERPYYEAEHPYYEAEHPYYEAERPNYEDIPHPYHTPTPPPVVETESLCFKTTEFCNQQFNPGFFFTSRQFELQCAPCIDNARILADSGAQPVLSSISLAPPVLSNCSWTTQEASINGANCQPVPDRPGWNYCGTYLGQCYLNKDTSNGCDFPATTGNTVVAVQGLIYHLEKAVRVGDKSPAACPGRRFIDPADNEPAAAGPDAKKQPAPTASGTQSGVKGTTSAAAGDQVPVGSAYLYEGTITVYGTHPLEYKFGRHRYSVFFPRDPPNQNIDTTVGLERLGDRFHSFSFVKESTHKAQQPYGY